MPQLSSLQFMSTCAASDAHAPLSGDCQNPTQAEVNVRCSDIIDSGTLACVVAMGVLRRCTAIMSALPCSSGRGTITRLDNLPGRVNAVSSTCRQHTSEHQAVVMHRKRK